jgi:hypothetical protein
VRTTETKTCSDCHLSAKDDNNAIMAQLLLLGTNYVNFVGLNAWTGLEGGFEAVRVTEWDEPQAVLGSYLHKYAYPDYYRQFVEDNGRELRDWTRGQTLDGDLSGETHPIERFRNVTEGRATASAACSCAASTCTSPRGAAASGSTTSPRSPTRACPSRSSEGRSRRSGTTPASTPGTPPAWRCRPTSRSRPRAARRWRRRRSADAAGKPVLKADGTPLTLLAANQEQAFKPIYHYAAVTDAEEGLILVNIDTMADGELPQQQAQARGDLE